MIKKLEICKAERAIFSNQRRCTLDMELSQKIAEILKGYPIFNQQEAKDLAFKIRTIMMGHIRERCNGITDDVVDMVSSKATLAFVERYFRPIRRPGVGG